MYKLFMGIILILVTLPAYTNVCQLRAVTIVGKIDNNTYEIIDHSYRKHAILKTHQTVFTSTGWTAIKTLSNYTKTEIQTKNGFTEVWKVYDECSKQMQELHRILNIDNLKKELKATSSFTDNEIEKWSQVGGSVHEIMSWNRLVFNPDLALEWVKSGFTLEETKSWIRAGVESAEDAKRWIYCSRSRIISQGTALRLIAKGERIPEKCDRY